MFVMLFECVACLQLIFREVLIVGVEESRAQQSVLELQDEEDA